MRLAYFHTNTILSSWSALAVPSTLRRMGHEVLVASIPTDENGAVIFQFASVRELQAASAKLPSIEDLSTCDAVLAVAPEYYLSWLKQFYGKEPWCGLNVPLVAFYAETSQRDDHDFNLQDLRDWFNVHFYPALEDAARFNGHHVLGGIDTTIFKPCREANMNGHQCDDSCRERALREKKYDAAFIGSIYKKRAEYLERLRPFMRDIDFRIGGITVRDLGGERQREWAELMAENLRQIKVHVALPSNNSRMLVARPLETMACGTFVLTYRTPNDPFRDGEHCKFYDPDQPEQLANLIRYYLEHDEEREKIARAGCEEVHKKFSLEVCFTEILAVIQKYISDQEKKSQTAGLVEQLVTQGKLSEALALLDKAIAQGESADLWNDWATVHCSTGNIEQAERGYRCALGLNSASRQAGVNLGLMLLSLGRMEEAMPLLQTHQNTLSEPEKKVILDLVNRFQPHSGSSLAAFQPRS